MMKKYWYQNLWIWSVIYFTLGFFNILFAWLVMILFKPRTWCAFCPMGTMTQGICQLRAAASRKDK